MITVAAVSPSLYLTYAVASLNVAEIHRTPDLTVVAGGKALASAGGLSARTGSRWGPASAWC